MVEGGSVGGAQEKDHLWKGKTGAEEHKLEVGVMETKKLCGDASDLVNLLEEEVLNEISAANWATQQFDAALLNPFDPAL